MRFHGGMHFTATPQRHCVCFQMPHLRIERRMARRAIRRETPAGTLAICPAGFDCAADVEGSVDGLLVAIDPGWFSLAAAEDSTLDAQLIGCLFGYDQALLDLARTLTLESTADYPNGPLFWNEVAGEFIDNLLARHTSEVETRARGMLGKPVLKRLRDYIIAHIDEPIEVDKLASIAGRSRSTSRGCLQGRSASPHTVMSYTCECNERPSWFATGSLGWPKSRPGPALLTRATCRVGLGASTAFRSQNWPTDPAPNSRNLHDRSLSTS